MTIFVVQICELTRKYKTQVAVNTISLQVPEGANVYTMFTPDTTLTSTQQSSYSPAAVWRTPGSEVRMVVPSPN